MPLALSTLGCPELPLMEAARQASSQGYTGLELRSAPGGTIDVAAGLHDRRQWRSELDHAGMEALAIASYIQLCNTKVDDTTVFESALAQLRLAHDLGSKWLRVFPGGVRDALCEPDTEDLAGRRLAAIVSAGHELGVRVAVETHDSHPTARDVLRLIDFAGCTDVAVIWDVLHTWLHAEEPEETARLLGDRLAYVQVKDVASRDDLTPLALGDGVLPLDRCLTLARAADPTLWVSWEYERMWHPDAASLAEVGTAGHRWLTDALAGAPLNQHD